MTFLWEINVCQRSGSSRRGQVGVIIRVLEGKPDNIETRWLRELDLEDFPRVLGVTGRFARDVPRGLGVPGAGKVRQHGPPRVLARAWVTRRERGGGTKQLA
jgi:hypothetical protein